MAFLSATASRITGIVGLVGTILCSSTASAAQSSAYVFTLSNEIGSNAVLRFQRDALGELSFVDARPTGGLGTGSGLGSQNALWWSADRAWLFAVDAGSHTVNAFRVTGDALIQTDHAPAQGSTPISITQRGSRVYVLDAGSSGNLAGFSLSAFGQLTPIAGSVRALSSASAGGAQVEFTPDGAHLIVTEKATNTLDVFDVASDGSLSAPKLVPSNGNTPFGFGFGKNGTLIVSEAFGGAALASAVSSYHLASDGTPLSVSSSVPTAQTAACWIAVTHSGRYAYTTNTGSASVTGFQVALSSGALTRLDASGVTGALGGAAHPIDEAISADDRSLYVLSSATQEIAAFRIRKNGSLEKLMSASGVPSSAVGLVAR